MSIKYIIPLIVFILVSVFIAPEDKVITLHYAHMNAPDSVAGKQAVIFAGLVEKYTKGKVKVQIYPSSQLGGLKEMVDQVSTGVIAIHHNTMGAIGSLYPDFAALDTPYLYRDVDHLLKVVDNKSPVMVKLNGELIKAKGVRVLYSFYFDTRVLTCNKAVYSPKDLKDIKIRAIPFPIYQAAVEGLGAIATPIDWVEVPTALIKGYVSGQENPYDIIWSAKFYEIQKYLIQTKHIIGGECVVMNEKVWQGFSKEIKDQIQAAAEETSKQASKMTLDLEAAELKGLQEKGMIVIDVNNGLKIKEFISNTKTVLKVRIGTRYDALYKLIESVK